MLHEFTLLADELHAEQLSDALLAAGALSVSVEDAQADTDDEQPLFGEPGQLEIDARTAWQLNRLRVLIDAGIDPHQLLAQVSAELALPALAIEGRSIVEDADWVRLTQAQFPPTRINDRLWIVPSWHEPPNNEAINIRLDPGVAFGTGSHPTTSLCLAWLADHVPQLTSPVRVLDYGCGSGILAIAAAHLGATEVWGTDIDPQALEAARLNAQVNGLSEPHTHYVNPDELPAFTTETGRFTIVLANILANPLRVLASALLARVAPNGALVLAGLLDRQADELIDLYKQLDPGLALSPWRSEQGWTCLAGWRRFNANQ